MPKSMPKSHAAAPKNSEPGSWPALRGTLPDIQREATALETLHWCRGHGGGYTYHVNVCSGSFPLEEASWHSSTKERPYLGRDPGGVPIKSPCWPSHPWAVTDWIQCTFTHLMCADPIGTGPGAEQTVWHLVSQRAHATPQIHCTSQGA